MNKVDFFDAIYDNKPEFVKENFSQLNDDSKASVYYFACSEGSLEIVKWMLEESTFDFDERFYGCTKEEHGFMGACHEGCKPVREYLLKQRNVVLSDNIVRWMYENKLGRLIPKKMKM